jgi:tetratricopeptide (TPR) repeat protein/transcriptional regulator with XRE-family HTH domain
MPNPDLEAFAVLLKKYRIAAGLTQEELAEQAGISTRGISDLERGVRRTPYKGTLELLADALQLSEEERQTFKKAANRNKAAEATQLPTSSAQPLTGRLPLLGRTEELNRLLKHLAGEGTPILMLTGEPGIGKTRLLNEVMIQASKQGWTVLEGSCTRRGGQSPYAPLLEALAGRLGQQPPSQLKSELKDCEWLIRLLPELSQVITVEWQHFTPEQERRLVFVAVSRYLANIAGTSGTLLVLDDLQWAGGDALDLLVTLIHSSRSKPLRIIGAYRSTEVSFGDPLASFVADLARQGLVTQHELGPLQTQAATDLIHLLLDNPSNQTPPNLTTQLLERTGGIPFFLISCIRGLQTGTLANNAAENELPWDVKQTIRQRMAVLPELAQELLGIAAVIGRVIQSELLLAVASANWSQREIVGALEAVCRARLLLETEISGEPGYRFAHDLVREVVEANLSMLRHRLLHTQVANVLEKELPAASSPQILVYHYRQAGDWKNALRHLLQAIDYARQVVAQREEAVLLAEAIEYAIRTGQPQLCQELRVQRGVVCEALAMWVEADRELTSALSGLEEISPEAQAELLVTLAEVRHWRLDTTATRQYAAQAVEVAERIGRSDLVARALSALAIGDSSVGDIQASLTNFEAAFKRAGSEHLAQVSSGLEVNGLIYYWLGRYDEAVPMLRQALEMSRQTYNTTIIARTLANLGLALAGKGSYTEAFGVFEEARQFAESNAMSHWKARATAMYGGVYLDLFNYKRAEELSQEARKLSQELKWPLAETSAGIDLLFNYVRSGRLGEAEALRPEVSKAVEAGQGAHGWLWKLRFRAAEAELALAKGELDKALAQAEQVISQSHLLKRVKYEVLGLQIRGKALTLTGYGAKAKTDLDKAVELARATSNPAMFLYSAFTFLSHFKDQTLLLEAQSVAKVTVTSLEDEELSRRFLDSAEIRSIVNEFAGT